MLNEKPDDAFDWKSRLDELESLPGEKFEHKDETWEKLHILLNEKISGRKIGWYWSAAACLLFAAALMTITRYHFVKSPAVVNIPINKGMPQNDLTAKQSFISLQSQNTITPYHPNKKHEPNIPKQNIKNSTSIIDTIGNSDSNIHIAVSTADQPQPGMTNIVAHVDPDSSNTYPLLAKKKLRVVHVNELGLPFEDDSKDARYADKPLIYGKFISQEALYNSSASVNNFSKSILTLKINPQN